MSGHGKKEGLLVFFIIFVGHLFRRLMKCDGGKVTINDVARAAGVSKGTVDRVLHDRGEVSRKSREKVLKVIEELGYKPNFHASLLASQKERVICCVFPECKEGEFWSMTLKGIRDASEIVSRYGVKVNCVRFDQYSVESFRNACNTVLSQEVSGVVMAPMFRDEAMNFTSALSEAGIPYMFIDSRIDGTDYLAYFGMPMYESGVLCADILTGGRHVPEKVYVVRISRDKSGLSDPTAARRAGFMDHMRLHYPSVQIENVFIDPKDPAAIREKLDASVGMDRGCRFIVMFNSRIHVVADYLASRGGDDCRVVGFDALERNVSALRAGYVHALIAQHTDRQALDAVNSMADHLVMGVPVAKRDNFTQMDILNRYNCDYY